MQLNDSPVIATLMIVFAIALIGRACSLWADEMFQAYEVNHFSFRQAKIFRTSEVFLGIAVALLTKDVVWVASTHALVWVAQGAHGLFLVIKHLQPLAPRWNWSYIRPLLAAGVPLGLANVFNALMVQGGVILYKNSDASYGLVGNLAINAQALMILGSLFVALSKAALPAVSRSVARGDSNHRIYLSVVVRSAFVFGTLAAIWAVAIGADIVQLVLGVQYQTAGEWLWLMLCVLIPFIIKQAIINTLVAHGRYIQTMWLSLIGAASMACAVLLLVAPYGFAGVVSGILVGFVVYTTIGMLTLMHMQLLDHISDIPKLAVIATLTTVIYIATERFHPLPAAIVATLVLIAGVMLFGVIRDSEKQTVWRIIRQRY